VRYRFGAMSSVSKLEAALCDSAALSRPLCLDLDGTLITTNSLWEGAGRLLRQQPWFLLLVSFWLLRPNAGISRSIASSARLDPKSLPYRRELLEALNECRKRSRKLILTTSASKGLAAQVAEHLGLFDAVFASDEARSLKPAVKRDLLVAEFGEKGFDYVGNSSADKIVFESAYEGFLVGTTAGAVEAMRMQHHVTVLSYRPSIVRALMRQLRPHQWAKNALIFLPLLLVPKIPSFQRLFQALAAFLALSLCASAGYVFNDLQDIDADRVHATKFARPFASGALPVVAGPPLFLALIGLSGCLSWGFLPFTFLIVLGVYFFGTLSYSLHFKRQLMIDVLVLAGLYTLRILAGGIATSVKVSTWLLGFSMFLFTSLAFAKRYVELRALTSDTQIRNRGYFRADVEMVASMGVASGFIAALVFMLYVDSAKVRVSYRDPSLLWLVLPILLYWLGRIWLLAGRGQMRDDPVKFALTDKTSLACAAAIALVAAAARYSSGWITAGLH
jgi:4-hydroxybenzoate polyprenyltransferase